MTEQYPSMHTSNSTYFCLIYTLGLTLTSALIFGLTHLPSRTISDNMLTHPAYRISVSSCIILQLCIWCICLYSKRKLNQGAVSWGYFVMMGMLINWIGLTSILQGTEHAVFVSIFMLCFLTLMLIFCTIIWQTEVRGFIQVGLVIMSSGAFGGIVLFNNNEFYLLEHVCFMFYSLIFTFFFTIHPFHEWEDLPDTYFDVENAWQARNTHNWG